MKRPRTAFHVNPGAEQGAVQHEVAVMFDTPGVLRIGPYAREQIYRVPAAEARRLIDIKGFKPVTPPAGDNNEES